MLIPVPSCLCLRKSNRSKTSSLSRYPAETRIPWLFPGRGTSMLGEKPLLVSSASTISETSRRILTASLISPSPLKSSLLPTRRLLPYLVEKRTHSALQTVDISTALEATLAASSDSLLLRRGQAPQAWRTFRSYSLSLMVLAAHHQFRTPLPLEIAAITILPGQEEVMRISSFQVQMVTMKFSIPRTSFSHLRRLRFQEPQGYQFLQMQIMDLKRPR